MKMTTAERIVYEFRASVITGSDAEDADPVIYLVTFRDGSRLATGGGYFWVVGKQDDKEEKGEEK